MQPVPASPPLPRLSARALPDDGITLQWERITGLAKEIAPLFRQHWQEIAIFQDEISLDPNWDLYFQFDIAGLLHVLTVRADGVLVGYAFLLLTPHLHYASTLYAHFDMFWLKPAFRRGWLGIKMLKEAERRARELKATVIHAQIKLHFLKERGTLARLFDRLGYTAVETNYSKLLR